MAEPMTLELLPCPFCGGEPFFHENDWTEPPEWLVQCNCLAMIGGSDHSKQSAIEAWNARSPSLAAAKAREGEVKMWAIVENGKIIGGSQPAIFTEKRYAKGLLVNQREKVVPVAIRPIEEPASE